MTRSGLYVVPDPRRPLSIHPGDVREVYRFGGLPALRDAVRMLLWLRIRGRATSPAERAALVAWLDEETDEQAAHLAEVLDRPKARERDAEAAPTGRDAAVCVSCGAAFERPAERPGRPRAKCWTCSPPRR